MKCTVPLLFFFMLLTCFGVQLYAQDFQALNPERKPIHQGDISKYTDLQLNEDSLVYYADSMYFSTIPDYRIDGSYEFIRVFKNVMKDRSSFAYPFTKLKDKITILDAPDKSFRIYNWEVLRNNVERRYYGVIQLQDNSYIPLVDVSDNIIRGAEDSTFMGTRWFGCMYYNILERDISGEKIYFLLGWNGNSMNSEKKVVEAFGFNAKNQSVFGANVFNILDRGQRKKTNRFILEYQKGSKLTMNYDEETKQIIFDHCESQIGDPAKKYTYIPDGTYDGLKWDGTQWIMYENIVRIKELQQGDAPVDKPIK